MTAQQTVPSNNPEFLSFFEDPPGYPPCSKIAPDSDKRCKRYERSGEFLSYSCMSITHRPSPIPAQIDSVCWPHADSHASSMIPPTGIELKVQEIIHETCGRSYAEGEEAKVRPTEF